MAAAKKKIYTLLRLLPFIVVIGVSAVLFFYGNPERIIGIIGLNNAYALMFAFAFLGGLTTFNTVPYYSLLFLLATAGLNPFLLGFASAFGVMAGDSFSYFMGFQGSVIVPKVWRRFLERVRSFAERHPNTFPLICFLYGSFSPLSNDLITIPAGMARIPYLRVIIPLGLGNIVSNVALAYLAVHAYGFISTIFG